VYGALVLIALDEEDRDEHATTLWISYKGGSVLVVIFKVDERREGWISLVVCTFCLNDVADGTHGPIEETTLDPEVLAEHDTSVD
jgi:hypothetical protein